MQIAETDNSSAKTWGGKTTSDDPTHFLNGGVVQLVAVLAGLQQDQQGPQAANEGVDPQCDGQLGGIHRVQVAHQKKGDHRNAATKHLLK